MPQDVSTSPSTSRSSRLARHLGRWLGDWVHEVDAGSLKADALAGLLGALLVLPQGIAFATLAGLPPQYGLYSAIVPGVVAALSGSSRHVMSGPTNANSLALMAMLAPLAAAGSAHYIELALMVTLMVGLIQLAVGALRLGRLADFISPAALLGFTSGAAVLIGIYALRDATEAGIPAGIGAARTLLRTAEALAAPLVHIADLGGAVTGGMGAGGTAAHAGALLVAALALALAWGLKRGWPRLPHMLIALALASAAGVWLEASGRADLAQVGALPSPWPPLHWPRVSGEELGLLFEKALALSVIALGQSLSIAKLLAERSGQRLDVNREFIGQGLSNLAGGLSSCYLSCGSLNRSLPNLQAGARTPLAGVFASLWLLGLVALAGGALAHIPRAAIAGLLVLVAISLVDLAAWRRLRRLDGAEFGVALATLAAVLVLRIETAILLGTGLSLLVYLQRSARPALRLMGFDQHGPQRRFVIHADAPGALTPCPQLSLLRMEGSVWFGATAFVGEQLHELRAAPEAPRHLLVMAKSMNFIDPAGAELWETELRERRAMGGDLHFHRPRPQVLALWRKSGFLDRLGPGHIHPDKKSAIAAIYRQLDAARCARCQARVFWECRQDDPGAAN